MEFCLDYQITILEMDWNKDYIASEELIEHSNYDLDPSVGLYIGTKTSSLWGVLLGYNVTHWQKRIRFLKNIKLDCIWCFLSSPMKIRANIFENRDKTGVERQQNLSHSYHLFREREREREGKKKKKKPC